MKMEAYEYLLRHSQELSEKYPGKYVAIIEDKVVAVSRSAVQAFKEAKKKFLGDEIGIFYMPREEETVTFL
jgi:hypothetical protein